MTLQMIIRTWKQSGSVNDFYDFDNVENEEINFRIDNQLYAKSTGFFWNDPEHIVHLESDQDHLTNSILVGKVQNKLLFSIQYNCTDEAFIINSGFAYKSIFGYETVERLYKVIEPEENEEFRIGDVLKIGRVRLKILKIPIAISKDDAHDIIKEDINNFTSIFTNNASDTISENHDSDNETKCRVCLSSHSLFDDPLISPCNCSGSVGHIHFKCLKLSLKLNMFITSLNFTTYYMLKSMCCEICKMRYPSKILIKNLSNKLVQLELIELIVPNDDCLILEYSVFCDIKHHYYIKGFIVVDLQLAKRFDLIKPNHQTLSLGRNFDNSIILKDSTISRNHLKFEIADNRLFVSPQNSKFGTLKYINQSALLLNPEAISDQSKRERLVQKFGIEPIFPSAKLATGRHIFEFSFSSNSLSYISGLFTNLFKRSENEIDKSKLENGSVEVRLDDRIRIRSQNQFEYTKNRDYDSIYEIVLNVDCIKETKASTINTLQYTSKLD